MEPLHESAERIIKHYESLHDGDLKRAGLQPKLCPAGIWTGGWGRALTDPVTGKFLKGAADKARAYELYGNTTMEQAVEWLQSDGGRFTAIVRSYMGPKASPIQVAAHVCLAYNIGAGRYATSSALKLFKQDKIAESADAILLWNKGDTNGDGKLEILPGLVHRRRSERHLFLTGEVKFFNV